MKAFHNSQAVKDFYVSRLKEHIKYGQLEPGFYGYSWSTCSGGLMGCITHTNNFEIYPNILGLPVWYAYMCEAIFDRLPTDKAFAFALASLTAIKPGVDIEHVKWQSAYARHFKDLQVVKQHHPCDITQEKLLLKTIYFCKQKSLKKRTRTNIKELLIQHVLQSKYPYTTAQVALKSAHATIVSDEVDNSIIISSVIADYYLADKCYIQEAENLIKFLVETK